MKNLFRIALVAFFATIGTSMAAQTLSVTDFKLDKKDKTACSKKTARFDAKGKKQAAIKLVVNDLTTKYEVEDASASVAEQTVIYVDKGTKEISFNNEEFGKLESYTFPVEIKSAKTYVMHVDIIPEPEVEEVTVPAQQFVLFTLNPENAVVELGKTTLLTKTGVAQKLVDVGGYSYTVSAKGYYPEYGSVVVSEDNKCEVNVSLRPANGWIKVVDCGNEELTGASIYVDGEFAGVAPLVYGPVVDGDHKLLVAKKDYDNVSTTITVIENDTTVVSPCLNPNFAIVTLKTAQNADIWANGVKKGTGEWTGRLLAGVYNFEAREIGYTSATVTAEIKPQAEIVVIEIPNPEPIYGNLAIVSYPAKADVKVNGVCYGQTPVYIPEVKYGVYEIEFSKPGYKSQKEVVFMSESMHIEVEVDLMCDGCCPVEEKCEAEPACDKVVCCDTVCVTVCGKEDCAEEAPVEVVCTEPCYEEEAPAAEVCEEAPAEEACEEPCCKEACEEAPVEEVCEEPCCKESCEEAPAETCKSKVAEVFVVVSGQTDTTQVCAADINPEDIESISVYYTPEFHKTVITLKAPVAEPVVEAAPVEEACEECCCAPGECECVGCCQAPEAVAVEEEEEVVDPEPGLNDEAPIVIGCACDILEEAKSE